jgi:hypothetical protein
MPWNDMGQLNYLNPEVREAVIQTILHVARQFPIIRFDAAMTLSKRHYQRLWFPEPGSGGDIPSRADHTMTKEEFNKAMPAEFWREVVDRIAAEVPDTLLLAEAFWLMEGYFVRTLGMHRVYNSAFMNMLKNQQNANYRQLVKTTLEFNPEILKRFVNFMNNPDEDTAIAQFGTDDKYFGVCLMMVTMPGLPMFGHGQIEGYWEKYGMEYRKAYWDEAPDEDLIHRHEREIVPLLHKRHLFAEAHNFLLYDLFAPEGHVNENVFAYSNRFGKERSLVVYNNKYDSAKGWIRTSVAYAVKTNEKGGTQLQQKTLGEGLSLRNDPAWFCIYRDQISGLEFIHSSKDLCEDGLYVELGAFKYEVFLEFRELQDNQWGHYARLNAYLNGQGAPNIFEALQDMLLQPLHQAFGDLVNCGMLRHVIAKQLQKKGEKIDPAMRSEVEQKLVVLLREAKKQSSGSGDEIQLAKEILPKLDAVLQLSVVKDRFPLPRSGDSLKAIKKLEEILSTILFMPTLLTWLFVHDMGRIAGDDRHEETSRSWIDEWRLGRIVSSVLKEFAVDEDSADRCVSVVKIMTRHHAWLENTAQKNQAAHTTLQQLLNDSEVQQFIQVNRHEDVLWFGKELFEELAVWLFAVSVVQSTADTVRSADAVAQEITDCYRITQKWRQAAQKSGYQLEQMLESVKD